MPYQRGAGMTQAQAGEIAGRVRRAAGGCEVAVEREARFFVVVVVVDGGRFVLRDEADWRWLEHRL